MIDVHALIKLRPVSSPMRLGMLTAWAVLALGCQSPSPTTAPDDAPLPPTYAQIAEAQNTRVAALQRTYSYGVLELKWEDERGTHSEPQVEVDLWLDLPDRTALRVNKLGEDFFWIGSDERAYWIFDLLDSEDKVAIIRSRDEADTGESLGAFGIEPESLLDLMALRPLPEAGERAAQTVEDAEDRDAWAVGGLGPDGTTRMYFQKGTFLPVRVELRSEAGELLVVSTLSKPASVFVEGVMSLSYPKNALWIDIVDVVGGGFAKLHLNEMTTEVPAREMERVFDLDRLLRSLAPHRVDGTVPVDTDPAQP